MKEKLRLTFRKGDVLAIVLVAVIAAAVFAAFIPGKGGDSGGVVQIWQDGALVREVSLNTDVIIEVSGDYHNAVQVENGRAAIVESDCPGADCVHSGWISDSGRSIVCLPNRVEVRVTAASDIDFVVG